MLYGLHTEGKAPPCIEGLVFNPDITVQVYDVVLDFGHGISEIFIRNEDGTPLLENQLEPLRLLCTQPETCLSRIVPLDDDRPPLGSNLYEAYIWPDIIMPAGEDIILSEES